MLLAKTLDCVQLHVNFLAWTEFCDHDVLAKGVILHENRQFGGKMDLVCRCRGLIREYCFLLSLRNPRQIATLHFVINIWVKAILRSACTGDFEPNIN